MRRPILLAMATDRYNLDHIAIAASDTHDALRFLTGELSGTVMFGGQSDAGGFRPMQVWIGDKTGDGMSIELIEPWMPERNDFMARFLARRGPGPHHLTFKVPDLSAAIERVRSAGFGPVNIDTSDPEWMEAFLLPREAHGTVVQLAQARDEFPDRASLLAHVAEHGPHGHPRWWQEPAPPSGPPCYLRRVVIGTPSLAGTVGFYAGLLMGDRVDEGDGWVELCWPSGAHIRVEERNGAAPGVDRLEIEGLEREVELIGARLTPAP